jgi:hypothetical protein
MKTHYEPYPDEYGINPACGMWDFENTETTRNWDLVDCKRCLNQRERIERSVQDTEKEIVRQMGEFVDFNSKNQVGDDQRKK